MFINIFFCVLGLVSKNLFGQATNPIIFSDVPDPSIIRVGQAYYMSSTTMHMSPGVPIMSSQDLVNWKIISYVYGTLIRKDSMNLENRQSAYIWFRLNGRMDGRF